MNYWKHSLLSKKKFNGEATDYLPIHKFLDSSKLFYFNLRHRILLHNTYGIDLCTRKFGETLVNSSNQTILVRDIAAEHCKEDLFGVVPTLNQWFKYLDEELIQHIPKVQSANPRMQEFLMEPLLMSGLPATLLITHSNFGVYLAREFFGVDEALTLVSQVGSSPVNELLQYIKLIDRWQYTADLKQLKTIENELS